MKKLTEEQSSEIVPEIHTPEIETEDKIVTRKEKKAVAKTLPAEDSVFVYIGPTIRGVITCGAVCKGARIDADPMIAWAIKKYPQIATLIVPGATLAADRIKVKSVGTMLHQNYEALVRAARG